ncbi:hypothetical protein ACIBF5_03835 [Micromonospora sp. NPDC050417]|uniref:hypothetical protein n=1 Tax=Micromonospora sp. NPDC050417 TaxID=3364280 RepID=UPI00379CD11B
MATTSRARLQLTARLTCVVTASALLAGGAAGCATEPHRHLDPAAALGTPAPAPGGAWPSYPLPSQVPTPSANGWSLPALPTAGPSGSHPTRDVTAPWSTRPTSQATTPLGGGSGAGGLVVGPRPDATTTGRASDRLPAGYQRSLVYSGLFGLVIAMVGITMIGRRRQLW